MVLLTRIDLRGQPDADLRVVLPRARLDVPAVLAEVAPICAAVRERGAAAVRELTERFDGVRLDSLRVPPAALGAALAALAPSVRAALEEAIRRARMVHTAQRRGDTCVQVAEGGTVTERQLPVGRVGLYVPGGAVAYPSSVVMNVVPAQVAGVGSLALASPPKPVYEGLPHPVVLAVCALLGVEEVYAVGGPVAAAMLAYGVEGCPPVDLLAGPGNVYLAAAKRLLRGQVGIDAEAGPTEIAVLADGSAEPAYVAADLIAQAEHDVLAACLLVTDSAELLDAVEVELDKQVAVTPHRERVETALVGQSAAVLVDDIATGVAVVDAWAPEHLEVITADATAVAGRVRNAGAIFVGAFSPVSLGDYLAGSNHVLPTGGTARHTGGLCVQTFQRTVHVVNYSQAALGAVAGHVAALGGAEDLGAHVEAVAVRLRSTAQSPAGDELERTMRVPLPLRADLRGLSPYGAPQLDVPVRLNTNENPYPPSAALVADLAAAITAVGSELNRYPDREARDLRTELAAYLGHELSADQVWAANGSNEIVQQILQAFGGPGRSALGFEPSYSMHRLIALATATGWIEGCREDDFGLTAQSVGRAIATHGPAVVFLTTPNNPTGTALPLDVVAAAYAATDGMVVVDEAYAEFSRAGTRSALDLLSGRPRLIVTRTMSKAFSMAGARVGYLAADPAVIDALRLVRLPYHLSTLTQSAARVALRHAGELLGTVEAVKEQRDRIVTQLRAHGLDVVDSDANFVLFGRFGDASAVWRALLAHGVLVRDVSTGTGLAGWLRVSAGTSEETDAFIQAVHEVTS